MAKLEWQELETFRDRDVVLQVSTATIRGRSVYSMRLGKLRPDDTIAPFIPVEFRMDDGVVRTGPAIAGIADLLVKASERVQAHADEADRTRAEKLHARDTERVERQNSHAKTSVGNGLARFTNGEKTKKHRDEAGKRQRDQSIRAGMKGKK